MKWSFACVSLHGRKSMEAIKENWKTIKEAVRREYSLSDISYHTWVEPLEFHNVVNDVVSIIIPSDQAHALNYISSKYKSFFQVTITEMFDHPYDINFILEKDVKAEEPAENEMAVPNQIYGINYEDAHLNPKYKFDTFVVGSNNKFAHSASLAVAESPGEVYNPLYLYGGPGLGKTHLMHSIGHFILEQDPDKKVLYVTSEEFTNEVIESIRSGNAASMTKLREKYRNVDVLMVDDVQFIIGKESTQEEFFHTFNTLYESGKQIVLTSDRPPREMTQLSDRLMSRFESGLMVDVAPPDFETRLAIIHNKAALLGVKLPDEVMDYIAENVTTNVRQLEGTLNKILAYRDLLGDQVDEESVGRAVRDMLKRSNEYVPSPKVIISYICSYYNIDEETLRGQSRSRDVVAARQRAMYLIRRMHATSLDGIGKEFGNRDHSTILHSLDKVEKQMQTDPKFAERVKEITTNISSKR